MLLLDLNLENRDLGDLEELIPFIQLKTSMQNFL